MATKKRRVLTVGERDIQEMLITMKIEIPCGTMEEMLEDLEKIRDAVKREGSIEDEKISFRIDMEV